MDRLAGLMNHLKESDLYIRLVQMKTKIENSTDYLHKYQDILATQKKLVNLEHLGDKLKADSLRKEYEWKLAELTSDVLIHEYLNDLEEFSKTIHELEEVFNESLNSVQELPKIPHI